VGAENLNRSMVPGYLNICFEPLFINLFRIIVHSSVVVENMLETTSNFRFHTLDKSRVNITTPCSGDSCTPIWCLKAKSPNSQYANSPKNGFERFDQCRNYNCIESLQINHPLLSTIRRFFSLNRVYLWSTASLFCLLTVKALTGKLPRLKLSWPPFCIFGKRNNCNLLALCCSWCVLFAIT
jgi:hypothetical protein